MNHPDIKRAFDNGLEAVTELIKSVEQSAAEEPHWTKRHHVYCTKCHHDFITRLTRPKCGECGSTNVLNYDEIAPRFKEDRFMQIAEHTEREVDLIKTQLDAMEPIRAALADDTILRKSDIKHLLSVKDANKGITGLIRRIEALETGGVK